MGVNFRVTNMPLYTGINDDGLPSEARKTITCDYCHKTEKIPVSYRTIKSDFDKAIFCSHNCRCKYYQEHEKEREQYLYLNSWEGKGERQNRNTKKYTEKQKRRYQDDEEYRNLINERAKKWKKEHGELKK